ncbi:MAG: tRNA uridine-5-carboxymethylaminomethyl(34) synthesis GTPase MnmE [Oscillospiraceae bacterium]|nr:tRNA uridine-5-carboxymethylaminomethyl(34) synthesis GTPase MnmE [Oscillospiraceae bacterium]
MSDTIAAIATGAQVAAIGILRLSGPEAISLADALFHPADGRAMSAHEDRKLVYGRLCSRAGELYDLCLCTVSRAPHSYTGENTAEFQCHGSPVVLQAALQELFALGARQAGPGEFTKRAFLNGRMDLCAAEAVADIIDAESIEAASNAAGQLSGAISRQVEGIYAALTDISSHYHAVLDYPDEDIEDFRMEAYRSCLDEAVVSLRRLLATFDRGRLLTAGIPTVIVGRPNAGKSSLLNALLGYDRAIVTEVPGTTRDTIEERLRLGSLCLRLTDTAGIRDTDDPVERLGVQRSRAALESAELVLAVVDGSEAFTPEDAAVLHAAEGARRGIAVLSKQDLTQQTEHLDTCLTQVAVSSRTGEGLDRLEAAISALFPLPPVSAGGILTNARQAEAVGRSLEALEAALDAMEQAMTSDIVLTEIEGAMSALGELSGRSVREDVTDRIFQRFCVGK